MKALDIRCKEFSADDLCPYLLADVSLADAAMLWLTPHVASARYRNISQRGIIRKKVHDSSFLNGIHIFFALFGYFIRTIS